VQKTLSNTFNRFFHSEKSSGVLLILCTVISLSITNSPIGPEYLRLWHITVGGLSIEHWINDALMPVFFLLIGLGTLTPESPGGQPHGWLGT
jgi:NhaA family Na+:H+ antiporter